MLHTFNLSLLAAFCLFHVTLAAELARANKFTLATATARLVRTVAERGCDPNVCFALDGSGSITDAEYELQKDFVKLVAGTISADPGAQFAAVQYGISLERLTPRLTSDADKFILDISGSEHSKASSTFIAPGLGYCIRQFRRTAGEANKIVLLGDGRSNLDSRNPPLDPASIASTWLSRGDNNAICAIAVHYDDIAPMTSIVGDGRVFQVADWLEVTFVLDDLVTEICGWDAVEF